MTNDLAGELARRGARRTAALAHDATEKLGANAAPHKAAHAAERGDLAARTGVTGGPPTSHPTGGKGGMEGPGGERYNAFPKNMSWPSKDGMATDPPTSEAQRKAMHAAAEGRSTLGIPKKVGKEFVGKDAQDDHAIDVVMDGNPEDYVGKYVTFKAPAISTASGTQRLRGKVTRVLANGKLEVRVAEGGYHEVAPGDVST